MRKVCNHFGSLFVDVKQKLEYRLRLAYAHFSNNANTCSGDRVSWRFVTPSARRFAYGKLAPLVAWRSRRLEVPYLDPESLRSRTS